MAIIYDDKKNTFTLHTAHTTYQMMVDQYGNLLHLYYGRRTEGCMDWLLVPKDRGFSGTSYEASSNRTWSMDHFPQEYPVQGTEDFRSPAMMIRDADGACGSALRYRGYIVYNHKFSLPGLPAVYDNSGEAQSLMIRMANRRLGLEVQLLYGVLPESDIITRSVIVKNEGPRMFTVEKLLSACLDQLSGDYDFMTFHGRHTMERIPDRRHLTHGLTMVGSRRGMSSHQYNPFAILMDHETTETSGRCWAMQFVYSGGFRAECELDQFDQTRLSMGLSKEKFTYPLAPGEELVAPEVIMCHSDEGLSALSHRLHRCIREHVCRGKYRDAPRPVLLNSWEASYFDFSGETILGLAKEAKELGMDLLVMDDGWFGDRNDDKRALGDWMANEEKLGCSLGELVRKVNALGVKFGIWMEPEMISEDSKLFREHPDWAMKIPGERPAVARNQLVLDISRRSVRKEIFRQICDILDQGDIRYLKWDYNRSISEVYSMETAAQGKVSYGNMLGVYEILERLIDRYPDLLIEGCSGGGGRFDAGMLYYTPQIWCSDNTDAIDRLQIQYGTSFAYPSITVGAHVSASPNHQTGRRTSLATRGVVAMSGAFGYELDPATLSGEEKAEIREQIRAYREIEPLVRKGLYYRLSDPFADTYCAWEHAAEDGSQALVNVVIPQSHGNMPSIYVIPRGLTPGAVYLEAATGREYPADALMDVGFPVPAPMGDGISYSYLFVRKEDEE